METSTIRKPRIRKPAPLSVSMDGLVHAPPPKRVPARRKLSKSELLQNVDIVKVPRSRKPKVIVEREEQRPAEMIQPTLTMDAIAHEPIAAETKPQVSTAVAPSLLQPSVTPDIVPHGERLPEQMPEVVKRGLLQSTKEAVGKAYDLWMWFSFFFVIYVILLIKIATGISLDDHLFFGLYSLAIATYILTRFILAYFHRSFPYDITYEPTIAFVVPAKNEGDNVAETLLRFSKVDYPMDKIEVIAINDGSDDNTYQEMLRAADIIRPSVRRVEVVDWKINRGKRHGMAEGVLRATSDIIIFIDSDSFVEPDCVRHLVKYFVNPQVGAVSGHTDVFNQDTNTLTRMQTLRYYIAFKIYKAAESVFGNVTCCPGCCSAYRRSYLMEYIDEWLHQRFFGKECTFGDDRSLTNYMIRNYQAVYSPEAKAYTVVPDDFRKYVRQQQRWKKSWIRETFIASTFIWKKNPIAALFFYMYVFLAFASPVVFFRAMFWHPYINHQWPVVYLMGLFLMLLLHGLYYRIHVGKRRPWFFAICTFWFYSVILMWQLPWALVTMNDTRWGTR